MPQARYQHQTWQRPTTLLERAWLPQGSNHTEFSLNPSILAYDVRGPLDINQLRRALIKLQRRHPALRTSFSTSETARLTGSAQELDVLDAKSAEEAMEVLRRILPMRLNLSGPWLWRCCVIKVAYSRHYIGFAFAPVILDALSIYQFPALFSQAFNADFSEEPTVETSSEREQVRATAGLPTHEERIEYWTGRTTLHGRYPPPAPAWLLLDGAEQTGAVDCLFEHYLQEPTPGAPTRGPLSIEDPVMAHYAGVVLKALQDFGRPQENELKSVGLVADHQGRVDLARPSLGLYQFGLPINVSDALIGATADEYIQHISMATREAARFAIPLRATGDPRLVDHSAPGHITLSAARGAEPSLALADCNAERIYLTDGRLAWRRVASPNLLIDFRDVEAGFRLAVIGSASRWDIRSIRSVFEDVVAQLAL